MEENKMSELEEMRQQLSILQNKLDKQDIVNEKILKASMNRKMSWIKKYVYGKIIMFPFIAVMLYKIYSMLNVTLFSYIYIIILCMIEIYLDYRTNITLIHPADYENFNLIQTARKLVKMKRIRSYQIFFGLILTIIWILWFGFGIYNSEPISYDPYYKGAMQGGIIGLVVGGVIGIIIAYIIYNRMQSTNDKILKQINDITNK